MDLRHRLTGALHTLTLRVGLWVPDSFEELLITRPAQFAPFRALMYTGRYPFVDLGASLRQTGRLKEASLHEVGHAYVGLALGISVKSVIMWAGGALTTASLREAKPSPEGIYDHMTMALAGSVVEILHFGSACKEENARDLLLAQMAGEFLSDCWGSPFDEIFAGATEDARNILDTPHARELCLRYAQLLERQGYLTKTQLKRLGREIQASSSS